VNLTALLQNSSNSEYKATDHSLKTTNENEKLDHLRDKLIETRLLMA